MSFTVGIHGVPKEVRDALPLLEVSVPDDAPAANAHVVVNHNANGRLECRHCGALYSPVLPLDIWVYGAILEKFGSEHEDYPVPEVMPEFPVFKRPMLEHWRGRLSAELIAWLEFGEVGSSSLTIVHQVTGYPMVEPFRASHPLDADDFRRCVALLDACPGLRKLFKRYMRVVSPEWKALITRWKSLEVILRLELETDQRLMHTNGLVLKVLASAKSVM